MCYRRTDVLITVWIHFYSHVVLVTSLAGTFSARRFLIFPILKGERLNLGLWATQNWDAMSHYLTTTNRTTTALRLQWRQISLSISAS